jgi:hypothetical protein
MNRRYFFEKLASGLIAASAPTLFLPKLIKPQWTKPRFRYEKLVFTLSYIDLPMRVDDAVIERTDGKGFTTALFQMHYDLSKL